MISRGNSEKFKYSFLRFSGIKTATNVSFNEQINHVLQEINDLQDRLNNKTTLTIDFFENQIAKSDNQLKPNLIKIKRLVFEKKIKKILPYQDLYKPIKEILQLNSLIEKKTKALNVLLDKALIEEEKDLMRMFKNNIQFQKALLIASPTLLNALNNFTKLTPKKKRSALSGLIKFFYRASFKTSPFSYFTYINLINIDKIPKPSSDGVVSSCYLGVGIFDEIINILKISKNYKYNFSLTLNETVVKKKGVYRYYYCNNNTDEVMSLKVNPSTDKLYGFLSDVKYPKYSLVLNYLKSTFEFNGDYELFLDLLIQKGFILFKLDLNLLDYNFLNDFKKFLCKYSIKNSHAFFESKFNSITSLLGSSNSSLSLSATKRQQHKLKETLMLIVCKVLDLANDGQVNTMQRIAYFTNKLDEAFSRIIYEDVFTSETVDIDWSVVEKKHKTLSSFIKSISAFNYSQEKNLIFFNFLKNRYPNISTVPILQVFEDFTKNKALLESGLSNINQSMVEKFCETIRNNKDKVKLCYGSTWEIQLENVFLKELAKVKPLWMKPIMYSKESKAVFYQFIKTEKDTKLVLNGIATGYGKWYGRFLNNLPNHVKEEFIHQNSNSFLKKVINVENVDSTLGNANIHPALCEYELNIPGGHNVGSETKKILLRDLYIKIYKNSIQLYHGPSRKFVNTYDLGFYAIQGRSALFKMLDSFNPVTHINVEYFSELLSSVLIEQYIDISIGNQKFNVKRSPRVTLKNNIIIGRQCWEIRKHDLLSILMDKTWHEKLINLELLQNRLGIPDEIFVTLRSRNDSKKNIMINKDDYKPFYINLKSPNLINFLIKEALKSTEFVRFTEMLPNSIDNQINGNFKVVEILSQLNLN